MDKKPVKVYVVAGVLMEKDNKFLLVQEANGPKKGLWNWPAGKVEEGDTIEQTAIKEAKEESGFSVRIFQELKIFHENLKDAVKHLFYAEIIDGELSFPINEIMDVRWFSLEELKKKDNLRGDWILEGISILKK